MEDKDFWELGCAKERKYSAPTAPDTSSVAVELDGDEASAIPSGRRIADTAEPVVRHSSYAPVRRTDAPKPRTGEIIADYRPASSLISHVTVSLMPTEFNYYERFRRNAEKSNSLVGRESPYVPYFSYIPQYAQLTRPQAAYYLWFRDNARAGRYIDVDFSYVLLYIYEIINLPDIIEAESALRLLTSLWLAYRTRFIQLDKYMSEWLADFCLISDLPMPMELTPIVPEIIVKASFKEFYLSAMLMKQGITPETLEADSMALASVLIDTVSDYDYRESKYYTDYRPQLEKHIKASLAHAVERMKSVKDELITDGMKHTALSRDAFSGSLCSMNAKKRIFVEYVSFGRSYPLRRQITAMVKHAENRIRGILKLKSRLSANDLDAKYRAYIDEYFEPFVKSARSEKAVEVPEYEKLYDAVPAPFTAEAAAEIERASWEVTSRLVEMSDDAENEPIFEQAPKSEATPKADASSVLKEALAAAAVGKFGEYCTEHHLFADDIAGRINDIFADGLGDIVLENTGTGYTIIEDYRSEIDEWLIK